jgi:hypothetical protein
MNRRGICLSLMALTILSVVGASEATAQGVQLFATLNGHNEVSPTTGQLGAGDPNGYGAAAVITVTANRLCFVIAVHDIDRPILAHIHEGPAGRNGPIRVPLKPPTSGSPGTSAGCVTVDPGLLTRIRNTPKQFYVNVHTTAFPGGAIRGQLSKLAL